MRSTLLAVLCTILAVSSARAQHGGDIHLTLDGGAISTGRIDDLGILTPRVRVFESMLGEVSPFFTDEPGFDSPLGVFPVPSAIGFRLHGSLRRFDPSAAGGAGGFEVVATEYVGVSFGPLAPVFTPPPPSPGTPVDGFTLAVSDSGAWHRHLEYTLGVDAGLPAPGVYLVRMSLFSTLLAIDRSKPFYLVLGNEVTDEQLDAAVAWVEGRLVCAADVNTDESVSVQDIFDFLLAYFAAEPAADFNHSGSVTVQDIFDFLTAYFSGCN